MKRDASSSWYGYGGFPSLFLLGGPNTGLGHNSVVFMLEAQIGHVLRCLRLLSGAMPLRLKYEPEVQAAFIRRLDKWMQRTIWLSGCRSWYLDRNGRNTTLWPGFSIGYWLRTLRVSERHYRFADTAAANWGDRGPGAPLIFLRSKSRECDCRPS